MSQCSNSAARVSRRVSCSRIQLGERRSSSSHSHSRLPTRSGICRTHPIPSFHSNTSCRHFSHYQKQQEQRQQWQEFTDQIFKEEIRHEPFLGERTLSDTMVENSLNDKEDTLQRIRQLTHQHIYETLQRQQEKIKDKWEFNRSEVFSQLERPKLCMEGNVTRNECSTSPNETLMAEDTFPLLKEFEELIPSPTMTTTSNQDSSPLDDVLNCSNQPENTRYLNHIPSLMDLLNQPMPSLQEASQQPSEKFKKVTSNSSTSSLMDLWISDDLPNAPTLIMDPIKNESHIPSAWEVQRDMPEIKKIPSLMDLLEETIEVHSSPSLMNSWNSQSLNSRNTQSDMDWSNRESYRWQSIDSTSRDQWSSKDLSRMFDSLERPLTSKTVFADGLALLSLMSNKEWNDRNDMVETGRTDETEKEQMQHIKQRILEGLNDEQALSTEESNLLLLHLGTSPTYDFDDALTTISHLYTQIKTNNAADSFTHSIVLAALSRKGQRMASSLNLVQSLIETDIQWTEFLINQTMSLIEQHRCVPVGESLINKLKSQSIYIPLNANISLLKLYKSENMQGQALAIVNEYAKVGDTILTFEGMCEHQQSVAHTRDSVPITDAGLVRGNECGAP